MPLNPEIPLSVRPFKGPDILATQEYLLRQAQERRMAEQDEFERQKFALARQEMADRAAAQKTIGEAFKGATGPEGIDRSKLMQQVMATQPQLWPTIATELDKADQASLNMRKTRAEIARLEREEEDHKNEGLSRLGFAVEQAGNTPEAWSWLADSAKRKGWASDEDLAPYEQAISQDPTKIASVTAALKSYGMRPTAGTAQAGRTREIQTVNEQGQPVIRIVPDVPGEFPARTPTQAAEGKTRVVETVDERGRKVTRIVPDVPGEFVQPPPSPSQKDERLVQVMGENGVPVWVRESQAVGKPAAQAARAVTGAERQSLAYYNRAKQASEDIQEIEPVIAKASLASQTMLQYAPNVALNKTQQAYRQAQRSFTEARLRKESGAAIPTHEYENDSRTYFAQPGDSQSTIEQKRRARDVVLNGLRFSAGRAYEEYYGEPAPKGVTPRIETVERGPDGKLKLVK